MGLPFLWGNSIEYDQNTTNDATNWGALRSE